MTAASTALLTYSAQVLILVAAAALAALVARLSLPAARLHYWRAVVMLCLLLPAAPGLPSSSKSATVTFELAAGGAAAPVVATNASFAPTIAAALLAVVAAGFAGRLLWLALGAVRLRQLRRRSQPAALSTDLAQLRDSMAPQAAVHVTPDLTQPVTFGWRRPIVLLPPRFEALGSDARRTVLCHELLHVQRRDWPGIVAEELVRAVFWFHPAMWWALDRVHLSREQVVDQHVMARTPARRAYMDALLQFADAPDAARPAIAFLRRRHSPHDCASFRRSLT